MCWAPTDYWCIPVIKAARLGQHATAYSSLAIIGRGTLVHDKTIQAGQFPTMHS